MECRSRGCLLALRLLPAALLPERALRSLLLCVHSPDPDGHPVLPRPRSVPGEAAENRRPNAVPQLRATGRLRAAGAAWPCPVGGLPGVPDTDQRFRSRSAGPLTVTHPGDQERLTITRGRVTSLVK